MHMAYSQQVGVAAVVFGYSNPVDCLLAVHVAFDLKPARMHVYRSASTFLRTNKRKRRRLFFERKSNTSRHILQSARNSAALTETGGGCFLFFPNTVVELCS